MDEEEVQVPGGESDALLSGQAGEAVVVDMKAA
jgi:hypothetical protein